ncbi:MAG: hypothetical protein KC519_07560 [Anaerolineae bacterium]|nr:hypothetical protein [Anaerolineae bacterium]
MDGRLSRAVRHGVLILLVTILLELLGACASLGATSESDPPPPIQLLPQTPEQVVSQFLEAWGKHDYGTMYALLSPESQSLYPSSVFTTTYENDDAVIGTESVSFTVRGSEQQGLTTIINYDATVASSFYGQIDDPGRVMRLTQSPNGWRVAWSRMDIFDGLAPTVVLEEVKVRQPRGNIYDRNGQLLVESGGTVVSVLIQRSNFPDDAACLDTLTRVFRVSYRDLSGLFDFYGSGFLFPLGDLDPDVYAINEQEMIDNCAIQSFTRETRRYVGHGALAHVTGAIAQIQGPELEFWRSKGYASDDLIGNSGIERQYEEVLAGEPERVLRMREPGGSIVRELARVSGTLPQDITLTIDRDLQLTVAQALSDAFNYASASWAEEGRSLGGGVVVLDVHSGAVLAMASYPTYDPGIFNPDTSIYLVGEYILNLQTDPRRPFFNRAIQEQYSPGSTFKIVTETTALAENIVQPDDVFYCDLTWDGSQYGDTLDVRYDWRSFEQGDRRHPTGDVTPELALASSCNPFFYQMGALLFRQRGPTTLMDYARRMGLGSATGLDLDTPPEATGQIPPIRAVDEAISSAIGQGNVQVTILQMARMVAGIANGGTLYRPYVVQQVGDAEAVEPRIASEMDISEAVLDVVRSAMCDVTTDTTYGTAWFVFGDPSSNIPSTPYIPCGKTGTAQVGRPEPHGWFVAYAPKDDPQIAIVAMIENSREGSETSAPIVRRVLDYYFQVPPELVAAYPGWWTAPYNPLPIPEGSTGG